MRTAFVLTGGGSLGALQVGMLRALVEAGVTADLVVGTSAGALVGAAFAIGPTDEEAVAAQVRLWSEVERDDIFDFSIFTFAKGLLGQPYLYDQDALRELLQAQSPVARIEDTRLPLHLVAADLHTGDEVVLSEGPLVEGLLASSAIPMVFPPVPWGERLLVDGGITANAPLKPAFDAGAGRLIVLPTGFSCGIVGGPASAIEMASHVINLTQSHQLARDVEDLSELAEVRVVPPPCPLGVRAGDFSRSVELIDRASEATRAWLEEGGLHRPQVPCALKPHRH